MAEKACEAKTIIVEMVCDKCGNGLMKPKGRTVFLTEPPEFPHVCNNCGHEENYSFSYPYQKLVPIENLRDITSDERN